MKELEYPFDPKTLIAKKKRIKRQLLENGNNWLEKKIAILGGSTTDEIKLMLELFLLNQGIRPEFYESEYNQWYEDGMFPSEELCAFSPDVVYIHTTNRNVIAYPEIGSDKNQVESLLNDTFQKFQGVWENIKARFHCPIIQNNFEMPSYRLMGNRDAWDLSGGGYFLTRLNLKFYEYAQTHEEFYICDINYISADYGLAQWQDSLYWHMYKYAMSINAIPYLAYTVSNIIKSIFGKNKKGFVLDLDNTLWGGVIGDDGVQNIVLGPEESEGQAYSEFQRYLKVHQKIGVILNINSKNEHENAIAGINHPDSVFAVDDFIVIKANWEPKSENYKAIAAELSLLPESLVFVDDNPAERFIVTEQLPGVSAPDIGKISNYIKVIDRSGFFEVTKLSADDFQRNEMYKENAKRASLESSFTDYKDYLRSLEMKAVIKEFEPVYMARIAQLTNKSNQFNLTTKRFTQAEIEACAADGTYIDLYGKLTDRFGDNGVVSVVIGHELDKVCYIELWLMSCRVLKRDMEFAMMDELVRICYERGIKKIVGYYYPTAKNGMVKNFYALQGFEKIAEDDNGNATWVFDLNTGYEQKNDVIRVNSEGGNGSES